MSYAVLLYFDPQTEATIQKLMVEVSKQLGAGELLPEGFRPHLTLTGFEKPPAEGFRTSLKAFASKTPYIPIRLAAVGAFPTDQGVVYLAPSISQQLLKVHLNLYKLLDEFEIESNANFAQGVWVPHCSVAYGLTPEHACQAIATILEANVFVAGELVAMGLTEFLPIKELCNYPLKGESPEK